MQQVFFSIEQVTGMKPNTSIGVAAAEQIRWVIKADLKLTVEFQRFLKV